MVLNARNGHQSEIETGTIHRRPRWWLFLRSDRAGPHCPVVTRSLHLLPVRLSTAAGGEWPVRKSQARPNPPVVSLQNRPSSTLSRLPARLLSLSTLRHPAIRLYLLGICPAHSPHSAQLCHVCSKAKEESGGWQLERPAPGLRWHSPALCVQFHGGTPALHQCGHSRRRLARVRQEVRQDRTLRLESDGHGRGLFHRHQRCLVARVTLQVSPLRQPNRQVFAFHHSALVAWLRPTGSREESQLPGASHRVRSPLELFLHNRFH